MQQKKYFVDICAQKNFALIKVLCCSRKLSLKIKKLWLFTDHFKRQLTTNPHYYIIIDLCCHLTCLTTSLAYTPIIFIYNNNPLR